MQDKRRFVGLAQVANQGGGPCKGGRWLLGCGQALGHQGGDARPYGGGQTLGRILDRKAIFGSQVQLLEGPPVGLGIGLLAHHILSTNQKGQLWPELWP